MCISSAFGFLVAGGVGVLLKAQSRPLDETRYAAEEGRIARLPEADEGEMKAR